jgi:hypothetical protein
LTPAVSSDRAIAANFDDCVVEKLWTGCVNRYGVRADRLMLNLRQQWNAMSTTTKIALVGAFIGLVG